MPVTWPVRRLDERLVVQGDRVVGHGPARARRPARRARPRGGAGRRRRARGGPAELLGPVHGGVGLAHEPGRRGAGVGEGDAGGDRSRDSSPLARAIGVDSMTSVTRRPTATAWSSLVDPVEEHDELVAAEAGDQSLGRSTVRMRSAIWQSRSSPTSWPRVSLTILNRSTSKNSRATWVPLAAGPGQAPSRGGRAAAPGWAGRSAGRAGPGGPRRPRPGGGRSCPGPRRQLAGAGRPSSALGPEGDLDVDGLAAGAPHGELAVPGVLGLDLGEDLGLEAAQRLRR